MEEISDMNYIKFLSTVLLNVFFGPRMAQSQKRLAWRSLIIAPQAPWLDLGIRSLEETGKEVKNRKRKGMRERGNKMGGRHGNLPQGPEA